MSATVQRSFAAGEVSPAMQARVDTVRYATGVATMRNNLIMRFGGSASRPGTEYVGSVRSSGNTARLIPFVFNNSQTYVLEFGFESMRVIKNGAHIISVVRTITGVSQSNPAVVTSAGHAFTNGQQLTITGIAGMTQLNGRTFTVAGATTNTFQLNLITGGSLDSTGYSAYTGGGSANLIYEIVTPYRDTDAATLHYTQSADVITLTHPSYPPYQLSRLGDANWTLTQLTFAAAIAAPTGLTDSVGGAPSGNAASWVVTAVDANGNESIASAPYSMYWPAAGSPAQDTLSWNPVGGAITYNVYRAQSGIYGYIGSAATTSFIDNSTPISGQPGILNPPDITKNPPLFRNPFPGVNDYPVAIAYFGQRQFFANTNNNPETVYGSQPGSYRSFDVHSPLIDSDAVTFSLIGSGRANPVQHLLSLRTLLIFTSGGEWAAKGNANGVITPTEVNLVQYSNYGCSGLPPLVIGSDALFVQARGSIVRDLGFDFATDTYKGNDLTIFSGHLVDGYTLNDWAFAQTPNSIAWIVRSDGVLLGLTYLKEQQIFGWHRHDTDGVFENVCSVPEGSEDALYAVVRRTVNGASVRYIERFGSRLITTGSDAIRYVGMDASVYFDGLSQVSGTMTLSGGTNWDQTELLTLTASTANTFTQPSQVIVLCDAAGNTIRFTGSALVSGTVLKGTVNKSVPASLRGTAFRWWPAVNTVYGLWHLEGKQVSVLGDGYVVASPNNPGYPVITVQNGSATLPDYYTEIRVGLPFTCDLETLDLDNAQGAPLGALNKQLTEVTLYLNNTRGLWIGGRAPATDLIDKSILTELRSRASHELFETLPGLKSGKIKQQIESRWDSKGRIFLRQVDPVPSSVLAVAPSGFIPGTGG